MQDGPGGVVVYCVGLVADQQYDRPASGERGERFVGGVEEQDAALQPADRLRRGEVWSGIAPGAGIGTSGGIGIVPVDRVIGQQLQRRSPRPTSVDVGGLQLSVAYRLR